MGNEPKEENMSKVYTCNDCGRTDVFKDDQDAKRYDWVQLVIPIWNDRKIWLCYKCFVHWQNYLIYNGEIV